MCRPFVLTPDAAMQLIDLCYSRMQLPVLLYPYIFEEGRADAPFAYAADVDSTDIILLQASTAYEIKYDSYSLNYGAIAARIIAEIRKLGSEEDKLIRHWHLNGLLKGNREVQRDCAEKFARRLPTDTDEQRLVVDLLRDTCCETLGVADLARGFRRVKEMLSDKPMGIVTYVRTYMEDGRPVSWPPTFRDDVIRAAAEAGLECFDPPSELIAKYGVETILTKDQVHYKEDFLPVVGDALLEFCQKVADHARDRAPAAVQ